MNVQKSLIYSMLSFGLDLTHDWRFCGSVVFVVKTTKHIRLKYKNNKNPAVSQQTV